jgi:hypothetical protein
MTGQSPLVGLYIKHMENNLNKGTGAYAIGMENAFQACYKWQKDKSQFHPILGPDALLETFPFEDCY